MAQSLFDSYDGDAELPPEKPPRDWKKILKISAAAVLAVGLGVGGYFGYTTLFPKPLPQRPVPPNEARLFEELKDARDDIDSQTRDIYARIQQFNQKMKMIGHKQVSFSQIFLQGLSAEEQQALDELVRQEKDPSYRGILGQVVEDMKKIRDLQAKVTDLEGKLPGDGVEVKPGDTHMKLAKEFLIKQRGVPESRAGELVARLNIMESGLEKGMRVHFYYDPAKDFFGTWVAQGDAARSPLAIVRAREMKLIGERDQAIAKATGFENDKIELETLRDQLKDEIAQLEARKSMLESNVAQLEADKSKAEREAMLKGSQLAARENSMFYDADLEDRLRARGVLKMFNKIESIADVKFTDSIDLRSSKSLTLKPSQFGIAEIKDIRIVPSYIEEGRDLGVKFGDDGTIEVTVLNEAAVKGQRILFVLAKGER
jgi:hypothetical protein